MRRISDRAIRRIVVVLLAAAMAPCGCRRASNNDDKTAAATEQEGKAILESLENLIRLSDEATSPVTISLPTGETATGHRPKPFDLPATRAAEPSPIRDALGAAGRAVSRTPAHPGGFDWAPGSSTILLVADREGVWRVDVENGDARRWLALPDDFVPRQVVSDPGGRVLLAQPGRAWIVRWETEGRDNAVAQDLRPAVSPTGFEFNYAGWSPAGHSIFGILEYLQFGSALAPADSPSKDERIHLGAMRWIPGDNAPSPFEGPALDDVAWIGSAPASGEWIALRKNPGQIDPFPGQLLRWDAKTREWTPLFDDAGEWTDADPSFARLENGENVGHENAEDGKAEDGGGAATPETVAAAWIRRLRPNQRSGQSWARWIERGEEAENTSGTLRATALPLSERAVERIALSADGKRIAWAMSVEKLPSQSDKSDGSGKSDRSDTAIPGRHGVRLFTAAVSDAAARAREMDLAAREMDRRTTLGEFRAAIQKAWAETSRPSPGIAENVAAMDRAFTSAAERALGIRADHSLASLAEIDAGLDRLGGDFQNDPAAIVGLGVYFGETLRRAEAARWDVESWPPSLDAFDHDLSSSDQFLYTAHRPFLAAREVLERRAALADVARDLLAHWPRPIHLIDLEHKPAMARIVARSLRAAGLAPAPGEGSEADGIATPTRATLEGWTAKPPDDDWVLLQLLEYNEMEEYRSARWRLAAEIVRRHPESARAFGVFGQILADDGWPAPAFGAFLRAAELDPADPAYAVGAALAANDLGDLDQARRRIQRARDLDRDGEWSETIDEVLKALE